MSAPARARFEFGLFQLNPSEQRLLRAGEPVSLTPKAFELLVFLVEHRGQLVTKEELLAAVWPETFVEDAVLSVNVSTVRKALGDDRNGHSLIETVPRRGYRFVAPISQTESTEPATYPAGAVAGEARRVRKGILVLAGGLVLAAAAMAAWIWTSRAPTVAPQSQWTALTDFSDSVAQPAVSADGRMLVFIRGSDHFLTAGQIYVKLLNGEPVQLTHGSVCKMAPVFALDRPKWLTPVLTKSSIGIPTSCPCWAASRSCCCRTPKA